MKPHMTPKYPLAKLRYAVTLKLQIRTTEILYPCTAISPVGLPSRLGGVRERERRTLSLSCKPEWNTLLQSAKLAAERKDGRRGRELSEGGREGKESRKRE